MRERFIFANNNITMALLPWLALLMWCLVYRQHSPLVEARSIIQALSQQRLAVVLEQIEDLLMRI